LKNIPGTRLALSSPQTTKLHFAILNAGHAYHLH
jgi:hypothetical protein